MSQECRAAKGRCQPPGTVDHTSNHRGIVIVGGRNAVKAQNRDAKVASLHRDGIDRDRIVVFAGTGRVLQVSREFLVVKLAGEYLGISRLSPAVFGFRILNREGYRIEIALELESGLLNKLVVVRIPGDLG